MSKEPESKQLDHMVAGAIGGLVSRAVVQPFDVVKIRFQLQVEPIKRGTEGKYHGIFQAIRTIYMEEGLYAFWKGHLSSQLQSASFSAVQFYSYSMVETYIWKKYVNESEHHMMLKHIKPFFLGGIAGSVATIFTQPFDVFRTRFAAQGEPKIYPSLSFAVTSILKNEGVTGLFRGLVPSLWLIAPQTGFHFFFYKMGNNIFTYINNRNIPDVQNSKEKKIGAIQSIISGGIAGSLAKIIVYPFDIVKKRMQVQGFEEARSKFGRLHISEGFVKCIGVIYKSEGFGGFFKGLRMSVLKSFFSIGLRFAVYEQGVKKITAARDKKNNRSDS